MLILSEQRDIALIHRYVASVQLLATDKDSENDVKFALRRIAAWDVLETIRSFLTGINATLRVDKSRIRDGDPLGIICETFDKDGFVQASKSLDGRQIKLKNVMNRMTVRLLEINTTADTIPEVTAANLNTLIVRGIPKSWLSKKSLAESDSSLPPLHKDFDSDGIECDDVDFTLVYGLFGTFGKILAVDVPGCGDMNEYTKKGSNALSSNKHKVKKMKKEKKKRKENRRENSDIELESAHHESEMEMDMENTLMADLRPQWPKLAADVVYIQYELPASLCKALAIVCGKGNPCLVRASSIKTRNNDSINVLANLNIGLDHDNVMRAPERRQRKFERDRRVREEKTRLEKVQSALDELLRNRERRRFRRQEMLALREKEKAEREAHEQRLREERKREEEERREHERLEREREQRRIAAEERARKAKEEEEKRQQMQALAIMREEKNEICKHIIKELLILVAKEKEIQDAADAAERQERELCALEASLKDEIAALEQRKRTLEVAFETYTGVKKMKSVVSKPRRVHRL